MALLPHLLSDLMSSHGSGYQGCSSCHHSHTRATARALLQGCSAGAAVTVAAGATLQDGSHMTGCVLHDSPSGGLAVHGNMQVQWPVQAATSLQHTDTPLRHVDPQADAAGSLGRACRTSAKHLCKHLPGPHQVSRGKALA